MHGAPSVSHPVGRSSWAAALLALVWTLAAASVLAWVLAGASGWRAAAAVVLVVAMGALAGRGWWRTARGVLAWDGARWTWMPAGGQAREGNLTVALDLQRLLLVHWREPAGGCWFWLQPDGSQGRWDALRRAVYSRAGAEAPPGAQPPSATP